MTFDGFVQGARAGDEGGQSLGVDLMTRKVVRPR